MFSPGTLDPEDELDDELLDDELDDDELINHQEDPEELELELELELDDDEINHHCALQVEAVNPAKNKLTTPIMKNFPTNFLSIENTLP